MKRDGCILIAFVNPECARSKFTILIFISASDLWTLTHTSSPSTRAVILHSLFWHIFKANEGFWMYPHTIWHWTWKLLCCLHLSPFINSVLNSAFQWVSSGWEFFQFYVCVLSTEVPRDLIYFFQRPRYSKLFDAGHKGVENMRSAPQES